MSNNNFDLESTANLIQEDCTNAKYLLDEVEAFFDCADLDNPGSEQMFAIRHSFSRINSFLRLTGDVVDKINRAAKALESEGGRHVKEAQ